MIYKATSSAVTKGITYLFVALITMSLAFFIYASYTQVEAGPFSSIGVIIISAAVVLTYLYVPVHYELTDSQLIIKRRINSLRIDLRRVTSCASVQHIPLIRLFGSGGLFGYLGLYYSGKIGRLWLYATRRDNLVLINLVEDLPIILSPDEDILFVSDLNSRI